MADFHNHLDESIMQHYKITPDHEGLPSEVPGGNRPPFEITDDQLANWAVRKVVEAEKRIEARKAFAAAEIERVRNAQEAGDSRDQRTIDFFTEHLESYFQHLKDSGALGRSKSYHLPHGVLQSRRRQPRWRRQDEAALLAWAKEQELTRETPAWGDISKRLQPASDFAGAHAVDSATGEIVPGILLEVPAHDHFSVKDAG